MKIKLPILVLAALLFAGLPMASSSAAVGVSVSIAPPLIPVYTQPYAPGPGYIWTPGYWGYSNFGYYWVPGIWVLPPRVGFLWTPGYWGYRGNNYVFYNGYWGPTVGYYGGINYGFGYVGSGYYGGQWVGSTFRYNTAVNRINRHVITNTYVDNSFSSKATKSRASFNGPGGVKAQRTAQQQEVPESKRIAPTREQRTVVEAAQKNPALHAKNNKGKPKAEAVEAVRSKVNPAGASTEKAARGGRQTQADRQGAEANQTGDRNEARADRSANREKANRGEQRANSANQADSEQPNRALKRSGAQKVERKAPERSQTAVQLPQRAPQRQQAVSKRRPAPNAARKAPAEGQEQEGKKKKRENDRPDGR